MSNSYYIVNVEAAIYKEDHWLIIQRGLQEDHAAGKLSLVGGKVEHVSFEKDVLEKTIKREIVEEVGIEVFEDVYYVESNSFVTDDGKTVIDVVFLCQYKCGEVVKNIDEVEQVYWKTIDEIVNNKNAPVYLVNYIKNANELRKKLERY